MLTLFSFSFLFDFLHVPFLQFFSRIVDIGVSNVLSQTDAFLFSLWSFTIIFLTLVHNYFPLQPILFQKLRTNSWRLHHKVKHRNDEDCNLLVFYVFKRIYNLKDICIMQYNSITKSIFEYLKLLSFENTSVKRINNPCMPIFCNLF